MKRILSIITAGALALLAVSCAKEELAVVDTSKATAPVLLSAEAVDNLTVQYTPAVFKMNFNKNMKTYHTLALVSIDGKSTDMVLSAKDDGSTLSISGKTISKMLKGLGYQMGDVVTMEVVVRGSIQDPSRGITNGYVDSKEKYEFTWIMPEESEPTGNPWADFTEKSPWGLIGSIASTGNSWNADGPMTMTADGYKHVARNVKLTPDDQFKVRKDGGWDTNFGAPGDTEPYVMTVGEAIEATSGGKNLGVSVAGNYDLLLDEEAGTLTLYEAFQTYPGFDEISNWSVIGKIPSVEMEWNKDIQMITDGEWHVAEGVVLTKDDQFKFRMDQKWDTNIGASGDTEPFVVALGEEYEGANGGKNLAVPADGTYDLLCNPATNSFMVVESLGGKSPLIGGDEPGPGPEPVTGWNIIGLNGDWENDIRATEDGGVWTAYITAEGDTEFKWRKDGGWDENYGGVFVALDEPFEAVAGGDNIQIGAGFWKVVLDTNDLTITISNGQVWSLIGVNGDWNTDIDMVLTDGVWVSPATKIEGEFKLRENHGWDNNRGGAFVAVGEPFEAVPGGDNINVVAGTYIVSYDPEAETIVVDELGWGLVGTINGWGGTPDTILKEEGLFLVARNVTLSADDEVKIRYNQDWAENRGGATVVGLPVKAVAGGDNIKPGVEGAYDIYYRPDCEVIIVNVAGADLEYWGVVGTINGWGAPDRILYVEDDVLVSDYFDVTMSDEIKIRQNEDWANNRGGNFAELGEPIAVEGNGPNMKVGRDANIRVVYDAEAETITIEGTYTGEEPPAFESYITLAGDYSGNTWSPENDAHLFGDSGIYKGAVTMYGATYGFKVVHQGNWIGGTSDGYNFVLGASDDNLSIADGTYFWTVNLVDNTAIALPVEKVGLIGSFNEWAEDVEMAFDAENLVYKATVNFTEGDKFKVRFNGNWDYNLGEKDGALVATGDDIVFDATGTYEVVLDLTHDAFLTFTQI